MQMCIKFSAMRYGLDEMSLLDIINVIIKPDASDDFQDEHLYNMDEVGLDITKHRNRVIAGKNCDCVFAVSSEGDGKMIQHTTLAITSRSDGELFICIGRHKLL